MSAAFCFEVNNLWRVWEDVFAHTGFARFKL